MRRYKNQGTRSDSKRSVSVSFQLTLSLAAGLIPYFSGTAIASKTVSNTVIQSTADTATADNLQAILQDIKTGLNRHQNTTLLQHSLYKQYGSNCIASLKHIVHDSSLSDEVRWFSLLTVVRFTGKHSTDFLRKTLQSQNWILKNTALKTAAAIRAVELKEDIEALLDDKALIVRTAAVDTIGKLQLKGSSPKLVEALFNEKNYHHGLKSNALWIHEHILDVLAKFQYQPAVPQLVRLLDLRDEDAESQKKIIRTLEKITGKNFRSKPLNQQVYLWKRNALQTKTF